MFFFEKIVDWNEEWLLDGVLLCCTWKLCIMYYVNMRDNILQGILTTKLENQINFLWRLIYNKSSSTFIIQSLGKMNYIARKSFIESVGWWKYPSYPIWEDTSSEISPHSGRLDHQQGPQSTIERYDESKAGVVVGPAGCHGGIEKCLVYFSNYLLHYVCSLVK